jgi:hypothetical protein
LLHAKESLYQPECMVCVCVCVFVYVWPGYLNEGEERVYSKTKGVKQEEEGGRRRWWRRDSFERRCYLITDEVDH